MGNSGFENATNDTEMSPAQKRLLNAYIEAYTTQDYTKLLEMLSDSGNAQLDSSYLGDILLDDRIKNAKVKYEIILKLAVGAEVVSSITENTITQISNNLKFIIDSLNDKDKVNAIYNLLGILPQKSTYLMEVLESFRSNPVGGIVAREAEDLLKYLGKAS